MTFNFNLIELIIVIFLNMPSVHTKSISIELLCVNLLIVKIKAAEIIRIFQMKTIFVNFVIETKKTTFSFY